MTVLVSVVKQMMAGDSPVRAVACASTGDTSAALAAYAACAGIPAVIFLPQGKVSTAQLVQPLANGAHVLALDTDFDGCMRIVREVTEDSSLYLANSMNSIRVEGQKTVAIEIVRQFDWEVPDWIVIPVGNLGNISALYKGLRLLIDLGIIDKMPRLVAAQASKANPFYRSYRNGFAEKEAIHADTTLATAIQIGDPVSYEKAVQAVQESNGIVEAVSEHELANAAAMADLTGMYTCPHTGVALAALFNLVQRGEIEPDERVVVISTAHGLKFTGFKVGYHEGSLAEVESEYANPPVYLPPDASVVRETIQRKLDAPVADGRRRMHDAQKPQLLHTAPPRSPPGAWTSPGRSLTEEERAQAYADWEAGKGLIGGDPRYRPGSERLPAWGVDKPFFRCPRAGRPGCRQRSTSCATSWRQPNGWKWKSDLAAATSCWTVPDGSATRCSSAMRPRPRRRGCCLPVSSASNSRNLWVSDDDCRFNMPRVARR